jgi:hypothetical protein
VLNAAEMVSQEQVLDSLRLFAREVMPQFVTERTARVSAPSTLPDGVG